MPLALTERNSKRTVIENKYGGGGKSRESAAVARLDEKMFTKTELEELNLV